MYLNAADSALDTMTLIVHVKECNMDSTRGRRVSEMQFEENSLQKSDVKRVSLRVVRRDQHRACKIYRKKNLSQNVTNTHVQIRFAFI